MLNVLKKIYDRYFHDEEAVILLFLIFSFILMMVFMGGILAPVIASLVLAFLLQGVVIKFQDLGLSHLFSVSISCILLILGLILGLGVLMPLVLDQLSNLGKDIPPFIKDVQNHLQRLPEIYPSFISTAQVQEWIEVLSSGLGGLGQSALSFSVSKIPNLVSFIIYLILVPVLVFFFMKDKDILLEWFGEKLPKERPLMIKIWADMNQQMANYVRGKAIEILIVGIVSFIVFVLFGLNYAALLAIAVGLSVIVPYVGALIVTIPVFIVAMLQWGWGADLMWLMVAYFVIQALDGNALVPFLFSEAVNLHPVAILLAILIFGGIWGLWGVFFAIPLATLVKSILSAWPSKQIDASL